ncbi:DMT family transporter [Pleurocapsales cyanobacterium LEGE 06147]|nr:DMT family transporter [Pleurocapsales cyanobacterium LEGE 06147]
MIVFSLIAAICFGSSDFFGGLASRHSPFPLVALCFQVIGAIVFGCVLLLIPESPSNNALIWGATSGIAYGIGFTLYYRGFEVGQMGLVSILTAVWTAVVPVVFGLTMGDRPSLTAIVGIAIALVAIGLTSSTEVRRKSQLMPKNRLKTPGFIEGTLAGICFGIFFIFLSFTDTDSTLWPLFASTIAAAVTTAVIAILSQNSSLKFATFKGKSWLLVIIAGLLQAGGTLAFLLAIRSGLLSLASVLVGLSPVPTILLARWLLREKISRFQLFGIVLTLIGIVLISGD